MMEAITKKPIYRKGVPYHIFLCVDCGKEHLTQKTNGGQPRSPRCTVCAARVRATGRVFPPEVRDKISKSLMGHEGTKYWLGKNHSPESINKWRETILANGGFAKPNKGKRFSAETREKIRLALLARPPASEETRRKRSELKKKWHEIHKHPMLGNTHTDDAKKKIAFHSLEWHRTHEHPMLGKKLPKEQCRQIGEASRKRWSNLEYKQEVVRKITMSNFKRPTQPESKMMEILDKFCPNEYRYTGNGTMIINGQAPDFTNINGKKKVIEIFGDYWHSAKLRGKSEEQEVADKKVEYAEFGYSCLIIWECEFKNPQSVIDKVLEFTKS